jgi:hypothetical protein
MPRTILMICAAGDIHGALDQMFKDVADFETRLGIQSDWVLHVGDFGFLAPTWSGVRRQKLIEES